MNKTATGAITSPRAKKPKRSEKPFPEDPALTALRVRINNRLDAMKPDERKDLMIRLGLGVTWWKDRQRDGLDTASRVFTLARGLGVLGEFEDHEKKAIEHGIQSGQKIDIPLLGDLRSGSFELRDLLSEQNIAAARRLPVLIDTRHLKARQFAFRMADDSQNQARGGPILRGQIVVCADFDETGLALTTNQFYVLRRSDKEGKFEFSLRRAIVKRDKIIFKADSSNSTYDDIEVEPGFLGDPDSPVRVVGLAIMFANEGILEWGNGG